MNAVDQLPEEQEGPDITLYWFHGSQPSRAIKAFMLAAGAPHSERVVDMMGGEHKTPDMLALNPAGQLPFLTIEGNTLA